MKTLEKFPTAFALLSNAPGSEFASESLAFWSSSPSMGFSMMPAISLKISVTAGAVASVRTLPATVNGPGLRRNVNCEYVP